MQKILITGATGMLGAQILRALLPDGQPIRAVKRANSRMDLVSDVAHQVEWVEADVTDVEALEVALEGVTQIIHAAAMVSFDRRDAHQMEQVNVTGTANLVNLALESGQIERFVHVSSIASLGRSPEKTHLDESCWWQQSGEHSRYARTKYLAEQEVWRGQAEGLSTAIVNPAMILGRGFPQENTNRLIYQVANGLKFCPAGTTGWVDARDVAQFVRLLLHSEVEEQRFILCGENWSYRRFFDTVARELGVPPPHINVRTWMAELVWRVEWVLSRLLGRTPMVTRESARMSMRTFTYANQKSLALFGDQFAYTPIERTIHDVVATFVQSRK
jgi:dihydroflavonol-4-reductase